MIYRLVPFSITLNDCNPDFKGTLLFDIEYLRNGTRYKRILTMEYGQLLSLLT